MFKQLNAYDIQRIKDLAIALYKQKHYADYEADLQTTICTIEALSAYLGLELQITHRKPYESVDSE